MYVWDFPGVLLDLFFPLSWYIITIDKFYNDVRKYFIMRFLEKAQCLDLFFCCCKTAKFAVILISGIRRLQTILLKVSLLLGARVCAPCEFLDLVEPESEDADGPGWRVKVNPPNHPLNKMNIDVLVGAEGKRVTVPGKAN